MTRYEQMTDQIEANTSRLMTLDGPEFDDLIEETARLLKERQLLKIGEASEVVR